MTTRWGCASGAELLCVYYEQRISNALRGCHQRPPEKSFSAQIKAHSRVHAKIQSSQTDLLRRIRRYSSRHCARKANQGLAAFEESSFNNGEKSAMEGSRRKLVQASFEDQGAKPWCTGESNCHLADFENFGYSKA